MTPKIIEKVTGTAKGNTFPHGTVPHCASSSAGPQSPDVALEGLSNAPYPVFFPKALLLPHVERGISGDCSL